ncbi:MAG: prolipoprotein diacylglyceryl transferase [Planctomycetes bacterium]|nr:prolipoprotein diacylglyceryl transferase [Planctomycetota bacterium]
MRPRLLEIPLGPLTLPINSYGFMLMIGFVVATIVGIRRGKEERIDGEFIMDFSVWMMIWGILGSRVFYILEYHDQFSFEFLKFWDGRISLLGLCVGWALPVGLRQYLRRGAAPLRDLRGFLRDVVGTVVACAVAGLVLGRTLALVEHRNEYSWDVLKIWEGGIVFYGGLLGAVGFAVWYIRARGHSFLKVADLLSPVILLGFMFGRVGCYLNGCCYGTVVASGAEGPPWWAIHFPRVVDAAGRVMGSPAYIDHWRQGLLGAGAEHSCWVIPIQFISMVGNFLVFLVLSWFWRRRRVVGEVFCKMGIVYPILRFLLEIFRGDNERDYFSLTISQVVSVVVFVASLGLLAWVRRQGPVRMGGYERGGDGAGPVGEAGGAVATGNSTRVVS